jgi:hypothetical protein
MLHLGCFEELYVFLRRIQKDAGSPFPGVRHAASLHGDDGESGPLRFLGRGCAFANNRAKSQGPSAIFAM